MTVNIRTRLREEPNDSLWHDELQRILAGERETDLQMIGGVQQYVERLLIDSKNQTAARSAFGNALETLIGAWRPDHLNVYYSDVLIQLITAYRPRAGFVRLLDSLRRWGTLSEDTQGDKGIDLNTNAMVALQSYYPVPPPDAHREPGFSAYTEYLWEEIQNRNRAPHAVRRLLELGVLSIQDDRWKELVTLPGVIAECVRYALGPGRRYLSKTIVPLLVHAMRDVNAYEDSRRTLKTFRAQLMHSAQGPVLVIDGEEQSLTLPADAWKDYMAVRSHDLAVAGREKVMSVTAGTY
jgi:hypothetical protein